MEPTRSNSRRSAGWKLAEPVVDPSPRCERCDEVEFALGISMLMNCYPYLPQPTVGYRRLPQPTVCYRAGVDGTELGGVRRQRIGARRNKGVSPGGKQTVRPSGGLKTLAEMKVQTVR